MIMIDYDLEATYVKWEKPDLNQQVKHINLTLSL